MLDRYGRFKRLAGTASILFASAAYAGGVVAAPVTPTFQTFGDLSRATFGGSGIPTDPTAFSSFTAQNGDVLTLGLSATQRFNNPALGNDGAGTYTAGAGENDGTPGSTAGTLGSTWNFNFFIEIANAAVPPTTTIDDYGLSFLYDFDPGADTDESLLGLVSGVGLGLLPGADPILNQGSENLTFSFLAVPIPGLLTPPVYGSFDPLAAGEYSFALRSNLGEVAINVNVVPTPATVPMVLSALGLMVWARRKRAHARKA